MSHDPLRPTTLGEFAGQPRLTHDLSVILGAARKRGGVCDHILLAGPQGLGKTTLAGIIANELSLPMHTIAAPSIERPGDLVAVLSGLQRPAVVFIDEIHALERRTEETLYQAMEDGSIDFVTGEGRSARTLRLKLPEFVLVGATTQAGRLTAPLRDRFGFIGRLTLYDDQTLATIVGRSANLLGLRVDADAALLIAGRSNGTPRIANRWLRRVRDWAEMHDHDNIDLTVAQSALADFGVDELGLDTLAREILLSLVSNFNGGPVGLSTLATSIGEATSTVEEMYEPALMRHGLLVRTPRGRMATARTYRHLELPVPAHLEAAPTLDL